MKEFDTNNRVELSTPPVPKARPPLRNYNVVGNDTFSLNNSDGSQTQESVHSTKQEQENPCTDDSINSDSSQSRILEFPFISASNSPVTRQLHKRSINSLTTSTSYNRTNSISFSYKQLPNPPKDKSFKKYVSYLLSTVIFIIFLLIIISIQKVPYEENNLKIVIENKETEKNDTEKLDLVEIDKILEPTMRTIQTQFSNQKKDIWNDIASGMYDLVLYPRKPLTIILFGNETDTLNCLAKLLGQLGGIILGSNDYLTLTPRDFPSDVGQTIHNFKVQITQKRAVVIQDLLSINTEAIKAFHNFCDREKPLVENAVYIMTVVTDEYKPSQRGIEFIERQITKKLSNNIEKDILDPLVTRLTDGIIVPVLPESRTNFNKTSCSLPAHRKL
ncbi:torsin interacting protein isoform X2 [Andrena cerasifolii]|uniref:torsin interacting protein isoform X2 n=1 Tax=Andrena cerasifolii TaxID=2819439 RepID=UPI0040378C0A